MKNQELKEKFLLKCNNRMKDILNQAFKIEEEMGKEIFELGYNEAENMVSKINDISKSEIVNILQSYTNFTIEQGYSITNVNVFDLL